jgi:hypothetical protein
MVGGMKRSVLVIALAAFAMAALPQPARAQATALSTPAAERVASVRAAIVAAHFGDVYSYRASWLTGSSIRRSARMIDVAATMRLYDAVDPLLVECPMTIRVVRRDARPRARLVREVDPAECTILLGEEAVAAFGGAGGVTSTTHD